MDRMVYHLVITFSAQISEKWRGWEVTSEKFVGRLGVLLEVAWRGFSVKERRCRGPKWRHALCVRSSKCLAPGDYEVYS